jgi:hypothetical protein
MRDGTCIIHRGNYSDYQAFLATQTAAPAPTLPTASKKVREKPLRSRPVRGRKPEVIERDISTAETELANLQTMIETEQQGKADWQRLVELTTQQGSVSARLNDLMHEWEERMLAEEG